MAIMAEKEKKVTGSEDAYYFGGPVPRELQEKLYACRDRGMTVQAIARKLAYLFVSLPEDKQNQLYFSAIDRDFDPQDKAISDLFDLIDGFMRDRLLGGLPLSSALYAEAIADAQRHRSGREDKQSRRRPVGG